MGWCAPQTGREPLSEKEEGVKSRRKFLQGAPGESGQVPGRRGPDTCSGTLGEWALGGVWGEDPEDQEQRHLQRAPWLEAAGRILTEQRLVKGQAGWGCMWPSLRVPLGRDWGMECSSGGTTGLTPPGHVGRIKGWPGAWFPLTVMPAPAPRPWRPHPCHRQATTQGSQETAFIEAAGASTPVARGPAHSSFSSPWVMM